jgi:ribosomal protein S12 methylthiotransferase
MSLQQRVSSARLAAKVGHTIRAIVDDYGDLPGELIARTEADAPGIDGVLRCDGDGTVKIGDVIEARVTSADAYDLHGRWLRTLPWRPSVPSFG